MRAPKITRIEIETFTWDVKGMTWGPGRKACYEPGSTTTRQAGAIRVHASDGAVGEHAGWGRDARAVEAIARTLIGRNPLERDRIYQENKAVLEGAIVDLALWDMLGKVTDMPVHALLGTYRSMVPAYASTIDGAVKGPLSTPESYADFAQQCLEMGYRAFKIHPFPWPDVETHIRAVLAIGERVGGRMDMMLDSFCWYQTFADALKVGRACDEAGFFWYEDPYSDGGVSNWAHAKLREMIRTPLLQGEKVRTLEQRMDLILNKATDFIRGDLGMQGLTGTMKLAHAAEAMGMDIEPHTSGPEMLHFMAAAKNANYYEVVWVHPNVPDFNPPIFKNMNVTRLDCIDRNGMLTVPDGPGFGVDYDWEYIRKHSTGRVVVE